MPTDIALTPSGSGIHPAQNPCPCSMVQFLVPALAGAICRMPSKTETTIAVDRNTQNELHEVHIKVSRPAEPLCTTVSDALDALEREYDRQGEGRDE